MKFVTLTVPNTATIEEGLDHCVSGFRRLRNRRWWKELVKGGVFVVEVTQRPTGYHVHLHIVLQGRFMDMRRLSSEWAKCSPGKVVNVRRIKNSQIINYLTKYLTKSEGGIDLMIEAGRALKGKRLFQPFGSWHAINAIVPKVTFNCPDCGESTWQLDFLLESELLTGGLPSWDSIDAYKDHCDATTRAPVT